MGSIDIEFEWPVDEAQYQLTSRRAVRGTDVLRGQDRPSTIVEICGKGGALRQTAPLKNHPALFVRFSQIYEPKDCIRFANAFGLLGTFSVNDDPRRAEDAAIWVSEAASLRTWVSKWQKDRRGDWINSIAADREKFSTLEAYLRPGSGKRPILAIRPRSLLSAMWLQFALLLSSDSDIYSCDWCGTWFERGVGAKRADSKYCSAAHRAAWHNAERRTGR